MELGLTDKIVLITGASQGIGKAAALAFAREGAKVAINARGHATLQAAAESPRVLRRLQLLRKWSHEQEQQIFA